MSIHLKHSRSGGVQPAAETSLLCGEEHLLGKFRPPQSRYPAHLEIGRGRLASLDRPGAEEFLRLQLGHLDGTGC